KQKADEISSGNDHDDVADDDDRSISLPTNKWKVSPKCNAQSFFNPTRLWSAAARHAINIDS
ncbi:hypothetical protein ACOIDH_29955, partial [Klebsiella pneumoniae]|uniref:hypothetical protein n=1 Tax=Klebsiella pneumoniae TaxID=573 RepID=UPI003B591DF2